MSENRLRNIKINVLYLITYNNSGPNETFRPLRLNKYQLLLLVLEKNTKTNCCNSNDCNHDYDRTHSIISFLLIISVCDIPSIVKHYCRHTSTRQQRGNQCTNNKFFVHAMSSCFSFQAIHLPVCIPRKSRHTYCQSREKLGRFSSYKLSCIENRGESSQ